MMEKTRNSLPHPSVKNIDVVEVVRDNSLRRSTMFNRLVDCIQFSSGRGLSVPRENTIQRRTNRSPRAFLIGLLGKTLTITSPNLFALSGALTIRVGNITA